MASDRYLEGYEQGYKVAVRDAVVIVASLGAALLMVWFAVRGAA